VSQDLDDVLKQLLEKREEYQAAKRIAEAIKEDVERLEFLASEELLGTGLEGVRAHGHQWRVGDQLYLNIPKENREQAIEAARAMHMDAAITVQTTTLKSFLMERVKSGEAQLSDPAAGTPLEGLVKAHVQPKLYGRSL
jgi:hypothetical protein